MDNLQEMLSQADDLCSARIVKDCIHSMDDMTKHADRLSVMFFKIAKASPARSKTRSNALDYAERMSSLNESLSRLSANMEDHNIPLMVNDIHNPQ